MFTYPSMEIDVVEHCNLSCAQCTHNAPYFKASDSTYSLTEITNDIKYLKSRVHFNAIRLVGGEPLLSPHLYDIVIQIVASELADQIVLVTNGLLLHRAPIVLFNHITSLRVNVYNLPLKQITTILQNVEHIKSAFPALDIIVNRTGYFSTANTVVKLPAVVAEKIYNKCIAREDGLNLFRGRLYKCYASRKKYKFLQAQQSITKVVGDFSNLADPDTDSIKLTEELTEVNLKEWMEERKPLEACSWCLGCSGTTIPHHQILAPSIADASDPRNINFNEGESYLSNCILSWSQTHPEKLENNPFYKPEHTKNFYKHFTTSLQIP